MILIISRNNDYSTGEVMDWIKYFGKECVRLNMDDLFANEKIELNISSDILGINNIKFDKINVVWLRRSLHYNSYKNDEFNNLSKKITNINSLTLLKRRTLSEISKINTVIFERLKNKKWLGNPKTINLNKIRVLELAIDIGLKVPQYFITNNKNHLKKNFTKKLLIMKPISEVLGFYQDDNLYYTRTEIVEKSFFQKLPDFFFPTFFQEFIDKEYEIRSVYLDGEFFSMRIHSQLEERTKVDFRHYDNSNPTVKEQEILPKHIKFKLQNLLKLLDINFASIDLLVSNGNIYFLEINPFGEFSMTSKPCNFNIEKKVAEKLIKYDNEY